ncbi:hypothetical protein ACFOET_15500 [Parapedobacter deserti]|uniref:DUF2383 domain-containing protein n=1 Tax=Parapedobacter deserti TaxID=1912957 RepID=A0ABV7JM38_9SPHI
MDRLNVTLEVLNDLIEVNGQRIWSYEAVRGRSAGQADDELSRMLEQIIIQGQRLQEELEVEYVALNNDLPTRGNPKGVILRAWDIVRSTFDKKGKGPMSISEYFDTGERAMLKAYRYAEKRSRIR